MIAFDSPLRLLPPGLSRLDTLAIDGIRHAAEIASLARRRLYATLTEIATAEPHAPTPESADRITSAYLDAWAMVDAIDRMCRLVRQLDVASGEDLGQEMQSALKGVRNLRNVADHLDRRLEYVEAHRSPALGRLSWFTLTGNRRGMSCLLMPGTIAPEAGGAMPNPAGKDFIPPTDHVTLAAGEHEVSLSDAFAVATRMVRAVEDGVRNVVAEHGLEGQQVGADTTFIMHIGLFDPDTESPPQGEQFGGTVSFAMTRS